MLSNEQLFDTFKMENKNNGPYARTFSYSMRFVHIRFPSQVKQPLLTV